MSTKDNAKDSIKEIKAEYDKKFEDIQKELNKALKGGKRVLEGDDDMMSDLKDRLEMTRSHAVDLLESGEDLVKAHPVLVVGGAMLVGILLGALLGRKSND